MWFGLRELCELSRAARWRSPRSFVDRGSSLFLEVNWDFRSWRCQVEVCAVTEADLCSPCHPQRLRLVRPLLLNETVQSLFGEQAFTRQVSQPPEDRRGWTGPCFQTIVLYLFRADFLEPSDWQEKGHQADGGVDCPPIQSQKSHRSFLCHFSSRIEAELLSKLNSAEPAWRPPSFSRLPCCTVGSQHHQVSCRRL